MSDTTHTATPWRVMGANPSTENKVISPEGFLVANCTTVTKSRAEDAANAARIVACVNALHGLTPEQVERVAAFFSSHNGDEIENMLNESGV